MNTNDRSIVGLVMLAHAMVHTYELSIPIFVAIWLGEFGVSEAALGYVVSAGYALFGIGGLPGGILADRYGSQLLIIGCLLGMAGSFLVLSIAPTLPVIALALVLWGIAASVYHPSGLSLISTGVSRRGSAFAYHGMAGNLGIALGPLLTTIMLLFLDWRLVAGALAIPAVVAAAFAFTVDVDENAAVAAADGGDSKASAGVSSLGEFVSETRSLFRGAFVVVFGIVILSGLYYRGTLTFLPELLAGFPTFDPIEVAGREISPANYFYSGLLMLGVLGQYVGGKLTDRMSVGRGIALSFGALAVLAVAFVPAAEAGFVPLAVVGGLLGFMLFTVQPFYQAAVAEYTPAGTRGLSYGYTYLGVFGVGALGGAIAGEFVGGGLVVSLFLVLAVFAGTASLLGGWLAVRKPAASR